METKSVTPGKFATNYGLILGLILILISIIMYFTGMQLEGEQWPMYLYYIIFPVVIIYAISQFKKNNLGLLSLSEALKVGLITAIISALIFAVYNIIFNYLIDPEFIGKMMEVTKDKMLENPNMTEEAANKAIEMMEKFSNPFLGSTIWVALSAVFGLIYSLIGGLVMKREA
ncbi:DUF4199 domain-containing protein [Flavivirga sp. 57AJ16]|uniref:DUF4199 domain-containing protein n=1 Tax=Flavivirga sp. 57AJ16 TaxID=3025307 RepID=UPI0023662A4E|nr:DUF4199 domain-containing protein [Flavivirga sp. 57AJ16]MDD7884864.1 DUF4199 domain-containing protein [Flavivirga sp. 57AJ16]